MAQTPSKKVDDDDDDKHPHKAAIVSPAGVTILPLAEPAKGDEKPRKAIGVHGEELEDGERDPGTVAEEQRRRSDEYVANLAKQAQAQQHKAPLPPPEPPHRTPEPHKPAASSSRK